MCKMMDNLKNKILEEFTKEVIKYVSINWCEKQRGGFIYG